MTVLQKQMLATFDEVRDRPERRSEEGLERDELADRELVREAAAELDDVAGADGASAAARG